MQTENERCACTILPLTNLFHSFERESTPIKFKRKSIIYFIVAIIALAIATPVLADYLGPNRTTTESHVETYDYGVWAKDDPGYPDNPTCNHSGGGSDCIVCTWKNKPGSLCGDAEYWYKTGTTSEVVTTTTNLPPATISDSLQNCNLTNGWCNTSPELALNGTEPLTGFNILAIEGSLNGQTFACSGANCSVPLNEGDNNFTFWALSSWGDSSTMGTFTSKVDTVPPTLGLDINASNGTNGWYVSPTSLTATGSDSTSGLSSVLLSVDNGAWESSVTLNEGVYNVDVQAQDNAGNLSNTSTTISVDTTTPSINLSLNGTTGNNGWYISDMKVTASASDATSGVGTFEMTADGGAWTIVNGPSSFSDGQHTVQFKATDNAGNETETPMQEFYIDTTAPVVNLPASWEVNDTIEYSVQDPSTSSGQVGSGLSELRVVVEDEDEKFAKVAWNENVSGEKFKSEITWDGTFKDGTVAPPGEYLVWIKVSDKAGNERFALSIVTVPSPFSLFQSVAATNPTTTTPTPPKELFDEEVISFPSKPNIVIFGSTTSQTKETTQQSIASSPSVPATATANSNTNVLWGATAAAMIGAATAYALDQKQKQKEEEEARRRQEAKNARLVKEAKQRAALQKIWDANGAAIYEANQEFKVKHGKEMDAKTKSKAIKDATVKGVFHAGAYASNLETAEKEEEVRRQAARKKVKHNNAPVSQHPQNTTIDSAARSYMAWAQAVEEGKFPTSEYIAYWNEQRKGIPVLTPTAELPIVSAMTYSRLSQSVAELANQKFRIDNPEYYRFGFAENGWDKYYSNCSNFVSQVLWDAGIRFPGSTWNGDTYKRIPASEENYPWFRTPTQQQLFSSYNGEFRIQLNGYVPLEDDPIYDRIMASHPQLFAPGSVVFTSNRIVTKENGLEISNYAYPFSHAAILDVGTTLGNPLVVEHDGPADYLLNNGVYQATWDSNLNDFFYERNPIPDRKVRLLSDLPTNPIVVNGHPNNLTIDVFTNQISIVPVERINLDTYGISLNSTGSPIMIPNPDGSSKPCYQIESNLLYCPPTVNP